MEKLCSNKRRSGSNEYIAFLEVLIAVAIVLA